LAIISKKGLFLQEEDGYFQKFVAKNGDEYGLRFGEPKDAEDISKIFKEIYDNEYIFPLVYDLNLLKTSLSDKNNFWFVGESLDSGNEIAGTGLIKKNRYIAHAGKAVVEKISRVRCYHQNRGSRDHSLHKNAPIPRYPKN